MGGNSIWMQTSLFHVLNRCAGHTPPWMEMIRHWVEYSMLSILIFPYHSKCREILWDLVRHIRRRQRANGKCIKRLISWENNPVSYAICTHANDHFMVPYNDDLVQDCSIYIALSMVSNRYIRDRHFMGYTTAAVRYKFHLYSYL